MVDNFAISDHAIIRFDIAIASIETAQRLKEILLDAVRKKL